MGRLEGKKALVTGAARGQGRSHAVRLAEEGADVIALDICTQIDSVPYPLATSEQLAETAGQVEALGRRAVVAEADVSDFDSLEAAVGAGIEQLGGVDIVVANAGIISFGPLSEMDPATFRETIDTNLIGVWNTCRVALPAMIDAGRGGSIVITSSAGGLRGMANIGHYVASKHGVVGLMRTFAIELAEHSIRVNTIHPGTVASGMTINDVTKGLFVPDVENPSDEEFGAVTRTLHLLPTPWAEPEDISNLVAFLASDEAKLITGATLSIDLGQVTK